MHAPPENSHSSSPHRPSPGAPSIAARAAIGLLWLYQRSLSPVLYFLGARCRHGPSCSHYAMEAFARHTLGRAFWLTFSRLARCHPLGSSGFDPVPIEAPQVGWRFWRLGDWAWGERNGGHERQDGRAIKKRRG